MEEYKKSTLKEKISTIIWSIKLAFKIDKKMFLFWFGISSALSILPAIALKYNQNILSDISTFLSTGNGSFSDVLINIIILGIILTIVGLSSRINSDLLYMMMYDSYYLGMEELIIDKMQKIELKTLLNKDIKDEYNAIIIRAGSLTDFISSLCTFISKIISICSLLVIAFSASKIIFVISLIYVLITIFINMQYTEKIRFKSSQNRENERVVGYFEGLPFNSGIAKEIRIYETYNDILNQWRKAYEKIEKFDKQNSIGKEFRSFVSGVGFYLFVIAIMIYSIFQVSNRSMTADVFLMVYILCQNFSNAIIGVAKSISNADYGLFALERQRKFILEVPELTPSYNKDTYDVKEKTVFELINVNFGYNENQLVLKDINLKIKKGEIIAFVGLNGSGKTTLVNLLINLYKPTSGNILFYNKPYDSYNNDYIKNKIGIFFQNYYLFHASLKENVGFGNIAKINDIEEIQNAITNGGADKILKNLPKGIENWIGKDVDPEGAILSGGEKQKVAVSRTNMSNREIMIYDEPAAALDPIAEMQQFLNIKKNIKDKTAIMISHRIGFARLADRIIVLDDGRIIEEGTHNELMKIDDGMYANFFKQQAEWYINTTEEPINE